MLSMKAKYGLRAAMLMADRTADYMQARAIAAEADVPLRFLETILFELRKKGIVSTQRGVKGGYKLSRPPEDISAGEIVRILDGMIAPIKCASIFRYAPCKDCAQPESCRIKNLMTEVRNQISSVLDNRSLQDLLQKK